MSKKNKKEINKDKIVRSINNNIRSSVRKLNPILKGIVGKKVDVAMRDLEFSEKRITRDIRKTLNSAVANAENNFQYDIDKLIVFLISLVTLFSENSKSLIATSTFFPTMPLKIGFNFLTLDLILLFIDLTIFSFLLSIFFFFLIIYFLSLSDSAGFAFLSAGV